MDNQKLLCYNKPVRRKNMGKSMYDSEAEVVWKDRTRHFGSPLSLNRYQILRNEGEYAKLVNITGFLTSKSEEVNLYRIDDFDVYQSISDKMFGVGTITVYCRDASCDKLILKNIKNPYKVRELLNKLVLEDRRRVGIRHAEMQY